jgi:hypothetical protein
MIDRRIVPDPRWIAKRYPIYITDGFSGRLPNGEHVGSTAATSSTPTTSTASRSTPSRSTARPAAAM